MNGLFPANLDEEIAREMKEAGFTALNLSLCTTSIEQLKRFRRSDVRDAFDRALSWAEKYGLDAVGYIVVGAPDQTAEESLADLLYLAKRRVIAGVSVFYPAPGSAEFGRCEDLGLLPKDLSLWRATAFPLSAATTREECATLVRLGRILNFLKSLDRQEMRRLHPKACEGNLSEKFLAKRPDMSSRESRRELGKELLCRFLHDGVIRGMGPDGGVIVHRSSKKICEKFLEGIRDVGMVG